MVERMAADRHFDLETAARLRRQDRVEGMALVGARRAGPVTRGMGTLLIGAGRRLAGPEALRSALEQSGFEPRHSAA